MYTSFKVLNSTKLIESTFPRITLKSMTTRKKLALLKTFANSAKR